MKSTQSLSEGGPPCARVNITGKALRVNVGNSTDAGRYACDVFRGGNYVHALETGFIPFSPALLA